MATRAPDKGKEMLASFTINDIPFTADKDEPYFGFLGDFADQAYDRESPEYTTNKGRTVEEGLELVRIDSKSPVYIQLKYLREITPKRFNKNNLDKFNFYQNGTYWPVLVEHEGSLIGVVMPIKH